MEIFVSYASENREVAERISLALVADGHKVFLDRVVLSEGEEFNRRIHAAIAKADCLVFLISPNSVQPGSYALTELKFAKKRWPHPKGRLLPVVIEPTDNVEIPAYLKAVTWLEPEGDIPAEVLRSIAEIEAARKWYIKALGPVRLGLRAIVPALIAFSIGIFAGISYQSSSFQLPEKVELLVWVHDQLRGLEKAHNALVSRYFKERLDHAENFIEDVWLPEFSKRVQKRDDVRAALASGDPAEFAAITAAQDKEIQAKRDMIRAQNEQAERKIQSELDRLYAAIKEAHTVLIDWSEDSTSVQNKEQVMGRIASVQSTIEDMEATLEALEELTGSPVSAD